MSALNPSDLEEDARHGGVTDELFGQSQGYLGFAEDSLELLGNDSVSMVSQDAFENNKLVMKTGTEKSEQSSMTVDNVSTINSEVNSPRETVSPTASSPFSAMESDGEGIETGQDDANLSCAGDQSFNRTNGYFGASTPLHTTTPCASSSCCDEDCESTGSRKKRRKTRRDMHHFHVGPSMAPTVKLQNQDWPNEAETSPFSPPTSTKAMNFAFGSNTGRRTSGGTVTATQEDDDDEYIPGNAKRTRKDMTVTGIKTEAPVSMDTVTVPVQATPVSKCGTNLMSKTTVTTVTTEDEQVLHRQYPRKCSSYELHIVTQPEPQHRARYLTEGSRGPVKDSTQSGFPKVQLLGYTKPVTLQVFVATDSGKIKPHGFYQACRVTGRNTSPCEENEIQGTKVIEIPFKQEDGSMVLNVDCVGILKLRNTDVEVRTGLRNQKRNQSVRLVFRVALNATTVNGVPVVLQVASTRISCTQPLGQPEITKKSIDRCSVEGGIEMFIIGKNFHRGTKVIYQDPEEPDGKQWTAEGEIEKDTFHQYHMVVRVPPYHDQSIVKPVNVQLIVEFQDKKCEPHSFTYTPKPKDPELVKEETKQTVGTVSDANIESTLNLLDRPIDKKFLVALFSKLLHDGVGNQGDSASGCNTPDKAESVVPNPGISNPVVNPQSIIDAMLSQNQNINNPNPSAGKPPTGNPNPVSPPSTMFADITVQNARSIFAQSIPETALQTQPFHPVTATNINASEVGAAKLIKTEIVGHETSDFGVATAANSLPALVQQKSYSASLSIAGLNSVPAAINENVTSANMVVSPVSGQAFQPAMQQTVFNSFSTSHAAIGSSINSMPIPAISSSQQTGVSHLNNLQMDSTNNSQLGKASINGGFVQQPGTTTAMPVTCTGNVQPSFPVTNIQVVPVQHNPQIMLSGVTSLPESGVISGHSISGNAQQGQARFSQVGTSQGLLPVNLQNSQSSVRTNVLQQPTFTFHNNFGNAITTTAVHNPQITAKAITTSQGMTEGQVSFGNQLRFTIGANDQGVQQQSMTLDQPIVITKQQTQQPFTIITQSLPDNVHQTFTLASKEGQNLSSHSFPDSISHDINQPFIITAQNLPVFQQQQQQQQQQPYNAQSQASTATPSVHQGNTVFHEQYHQIQPSKESASSIVHVQSSTNGAHSDEKQMQIDSFAGTQSTVQVHCATMDAMNVQTPTQIPAVQPMEDVLTQNFHNPQGSTVMIHQDHQMTEVVPNRNKQQSQIESIIIHQQQQQQQQHVPMAAEPSTPSTTDTPSPPVTDNSQQISPGFTINNQNFQTSQPIEANFENSVNQPMELGQANMPSRGTPTFQIQQQPAQNARHDMTMSSQNFRVNPAVNIHNTNNFHGLQPQIRSNQTFQTTSGCNSTNVEMQGFNNPAQSVPSTNSGSNFQSNNAIEVTSVSFSPENFKALHESSQNGNPVQPFQGGGVGNNLTGFQQSAQSQSPNSNIAGNDGNPNTAESQGFQNLQQQPRTVNMPVAHNFQTSPMNFNNATILDQQKLQTTQVNVGISQAPAVMNVENFPRNINIVAQQTDTVSVPSQVYQNMPPQNGPVVIQDQYQTQNQSTQSSQAVNSSDNIQHQGFGISSSKQHSVDSHPQINVSYLEGDHGIASQQGNHGDLQNSNLHQLGQHHHQGPGAGTAVNRPLEPHSPDIYIMTQLLQSIDGSETLASISGEDIQRHCL